MIIPKRPSTHREEEYEKYAALARRYFESKVKELWYPVSGEYYDMDSNAVDGEIHVRLNDDEVAFLKRLLDDPDFDLSDEELYQEIPFYDRFKVESYGNVFVPQTIDFDHPVHYYRFSVATLEANSDKVVKAKAIIPLNDEEYIMLLHWKMRNRTATFNTLENDLPVLHHSINYRLSHRYPGDYYPFIVFMDEVDEDVFAILGEKDFCEDVFSLSDGDRSAHTCLNIKERILEFFLEDCPRMPSLNGKRKFYQEIDALAVEKALGVSSYKDVYEEFKKRFGGSMEAFDGLRGFLDGNGIAYKYSELED